MPEIQPILDAVRAAYLDWGYPLVLAGALLENTILLGLILPGGTVVLLGAVYAQQGEMSLTLVLVLAWIGMVLGTSIDYLLGRYGLRRALNGTRLMAKLEPGLAEAERYLERYGAWAFLLAHFIGHIRSFLAITAGTSKLPYRRFLLFEGIAALVWNGLFVGAGYILGENTELLQRLLSGAGLVAVLMVIAVYAGYLLLRRRGHFLHPRRAER
jgi:membrane protein DedA with SNARE-associated domain